MIVDKILKFFLGDKNKKATKKARPIVEAVNQIYSGLENLSDDEIKGRSEKLKLDLQKKRDEIIEEISDLPREEKPKRMREAIQAELDEILPEAFALVKEACRRLNGQSWDVLGNKITWNMIPYDVQIIGGIILHNGAIAEMATGEGKTLVATFPVYLNALTGLGVHLITVNDYLAKRDSLWMGKIYEFLGLSVGCITNDMDSTQRRQEYAKDITYGTNSEFGFDYLRDNMVHSSDEQVQRGHFFCIVDEVDSVLIDEARTPLIISGPVEASTKKYMELRDGAEQLLKNQNRLVINLLDEAEKLIEDPEKENEAGLALLRAKRGAPKNKRVMKVLQDASLQKLIHRVEGDYLRDKKMSDVDEYLYFAIEEKSHTFDLTEKGREFLGGYFHETDMFLLPDLSEESEIIESNQELTTEQKEKQKEELKIRYGERSEKIQTVSQLLKAFTLYEKDVAYVVQEGKVQIVDEYTGRILPGRRYSEGLHQAIEAKERVKVEKETQTIATITIQNYFRLYSKLAGMTGTAETEETEFMQIYGLGVVVIPTNEKIRRTDDQDIIYRTRREKYNAIVDRVAELHEMKRPVLLGTASVETSEILSKMLRRANVPHKVLNAKYHQKEAEIISHAGEPGAITIATNMAGRGTDIKLGEGVIEWGDNPGDKDNAGGGLFIVGSERHESRRIDRQLRGRAGRQGDPGHSQFFISLEDDLMRLFGSERISGIMQRMGMEEGQPIAHSMITSSIERAQKRVEQRNFEIRKHLLEYDDVMNQQREVIYSRRNQYLKGDFTELLEEVNHMIEDYVEDLVDRASGGKTYSDEWNWEMIDLGVAKAFLLPDTISEEDKANIKVEELKQYFIEKARKNLSTRHQLYGAELMDKIIRFALLINVDRHWKDHLYAMDQLKEGVGLRAYGQKDPLIEYKKEGFHNFEEMLYSINEETLAFIFRTRIEFKEKQPELKKQQHNIVHNETSNLGFRGLEKSPEEARRGKQQPIVNDQPKVGRNEPCPCGSGKKYKHCCGKS